MPQMRRKTMGRPREFDLDIVLDAALRLFWEQGYEGTSYRDLTEATGVSPSGLYAVFGNKQGLFCKALERYEQFYLKEFERALQQPNARRVIEKYLTDLLDVISSSGNPKGCLVLNGALACSKEAAPVRQILEDLRRKKEDLLSARLQQACSAGEFRANTNAHTLACLVTTYSHGLAVQAASSADHQHLLDSIAQFVDGLPLAERTGRESADRQVVGV